MYTVIIRDNFTATHYVTMPDGNVEQPHSHDWEVEIAVSSPQLDENGFAIEFGGLKERLGEVVNILRNKNINRLEYFNTNMATAETVCKFVYDNLKNYLPFGVVLEYTLIQEEKGCSVKYSHKL